ncbi:MAG: tetratricopeptide repeat protein [Ferruginibacter sp.]
MDEVNGLIKQAEVFRSKEQYREIINLLTDDILIKNKSAALYFWRAWAYDKLEAVEKSPDLSGKAIADYDKALEIKNDYSEIYYNKGIIWYNKGEYDKSIAEFSKAIDHKNDYAEAYYSRGNSWAGKADFDKAIEDYSKAIEYSPKYSDAFNNRGIAWGNKGDYDNAIKDYSSVIDIEKNPFDAYNNRGYSWASKGMYGEALADYNTALSLKDDYANAYRNRGMALYASGDYQSAIADFKKAISIDSPTFSFLEYNIKLAEEKIAEKKAIDSSTATPDHKDERSIIEAEIDKAIDIIRKAARSEVKTLVHYTRVPVADIYVKNPHVKMHYSNAIYMNDPMEGKVFFDYLNDPDIEMAYNNGEKRTETSVYLGSFLPAEENDGEISHEDELVMWRTYGKDENGKEAAGCSVVLSSDFFKVIAIGKESTPAKDASTKDASAELLNVVYIKNQRNVKDITNDNSKGEIKKALQDIKDQVNEIIKLRNRYTPKHDFYRDIENTIFKKLSTISYLFKSADYDFEHEVRVITYMPRNSEMIRFMDVQENGKPCKRFHIESYNDILPFVKKIYLGPKVENYQQWSLYLDYEIRQRAKEIEKMENPPYHIKAADIEIMKSMCRFQ